MGREGRISCNLLIAIKLPVKVRKGAVASCVKRLRMRKLGNAICSSGAARIPGKLMRCRGWSAAALVKCWVVKYRVYLEPDEDGVFVATCPALPGCISQGRTRVEATENIREAIEGYLKSLRKHGDPLPPSILEEVIEIAGG